MNHKQFGGSLTTYWKAQYQHSPNWRNGVFQNLIATQSTVEWRKLPGMLCRQWKGHKEGYPVSPLPVLPLNRADFLQENGTARFVWYGHSVILLRIDGLTLLIDPMFGDNASPIAPVKTRRFSDNTLAIIDDLPDIDLMLLTHDHYDHLDYDSIMKLKAKTRQFYVALGVKRHLLRWGIPEVQVDEFDWWQSKTFGGIQITFTPTRHFSGRGLSSLAKSLWGGWALQGRREHVWFSGDGGYGPHFREIGRRFGSFDFGFMECGQYNVDWPQIHMFPAESVQAAIDAGVGVAMPVHWGGFNLSYQHGWYEPVQDFVAACRQQALKYCVPRLGELCTISEQKKEPWWLDL